MGNSLPFFFELQNFALRVARVARNIVCQLAGAAGDEFLGPVNLIPVGEALCSAFRMLITVDAAVESNGDLADAWRIYGAAVRGRAMEVADEGEVDEELEALEKALEGLGGSVMAAGCFSACLDQDYSEGTPGCSNPRTNVALHAKLKTLLLLLHDRAEKTVTSPSETVERATLVGVYGLYAVYRRLLPPSNVPDAKLFKKLYTALSSKCPCIPICGAASFSPALFLSRHAPLSLKSLPPPSSSTLSFLKALDATFPATVEDMRARTAGWVAEADSGLSESARERGEGGEVGGERGIET